MYNKNNLVAEGAPVKTRESKKQRSVYRHSPEYEIIVNLILKQYEINEAIRFDLLWAIQESDRIPALTNEFGKKRIHNLMSTVLREFCLSIPLPKAKKIKRYTNQCMCLRHNDQGGRRSFKHGRYYSLFRKSQKGEVWPDQ